MPPPVYIKERGYFMSKIKLVITALAVLAVLFVLNITAVAEQKIGLVDTAKILSTYDKAQAAQEELRNNQLELQKMIVNAREQLQKLESKKAKENLQQEFASKITKKNNAFKKTFTKKWDAVQNEVLATIKAVADRDGYTLIVEKQSVIAGGDDITDRVLTELK